MFETTKSSLVLVAALTMAGCGGSKSSSGGADLGAADATACAAEANAVCALRETCSPGFSLERLFGTTASCQARTAQTCVNALSAKGTGETAARAAACAAAYPSEMCSDFFDSNPVAACVPTTGTQPIGAACGASSQCATSYCAVGQDAVCGTCQTLPVAGAACQVQADCGRDLACVTTTTALGSDGGASTTGVCAAWVAAGGACLTGHQPCQSGLACVGETVATMTSGTCQAQPTTTGTACDGSRKTAPNCNGNFGMTCIPTAKGSAVGTCQPITLAAVGATCGDIGAAPITGVVDCANSGLCKKAAAGDATGVCVAAAADGAACDSNPLIGPPCQSPAKCVPAAGSTSTAGTCTTPDASACM